MPLKNGAVNEILPFAAEGLEEAGDLLSLDEYKNHLSRRRGHLAGLALRELQNREARQAAHMAAGLAQFIANRFEGGVRDDADLDKIEDGLLAAVTEVISGAVPLPLAIADGGTGAATAAGARVNLGLDSPLYELCEFYYFRHPTLKPGFQPAQGGLIANAATLYPEAWAYLQTAGGQLLCKTEAAWQAMTTAIWHTNADGSTVGWNGIGGAPFYAPNTATGALRLPDLRGMYAEAAGFDSLGVGGAHGDAVRLSTGRTALAITPTHGSPTGPFYRGLSTVNSHPISPGTAGQYVDYSNDRVTPTAAKNQPRAWGALACVYLGAPK